MLDGFTVSNGFANGASPNDKGGGMYIENGSPTISNVIFKENNASDMGGGMYILGGNPILTNVSFVDFNGAGSGAPTGGGIANVNGNPILKNVTFYNNEASNGAGMYNANGSPILENVTFSWNIASSYGGGMSNVNSHPVMKNVTFNSNFVDNGGGVGDGGGIYNDASNPTIINSIFWGNAGGEIENTNGSAPEVTYSIVQGGYAGTGNLDSNPLLGTLADNGGVTQTMLLGSESPAIDAGDNANCPATDQRGVARPQGDSCDIGAYEYNGPASVIYVRKDAMGSNNGTSWTNAYTDLQSALSAASIGSEIWVAAGTYKPTSGLDRTISFTFKNSVSIYGGFVGTETLRAQRNFATNVTILSGDIGVQSDNSDNSYHVMIGSNTDNAALLDGFTVTAGNANSTSVTQNGSGGGMYIKLGSPSIAHTIFNNNSAGFGGGIYSEGMSSGFWNKSDPILTNVIFSNNSATEGGGMKSMDYSNPVLMNVTFSGNTAMVAGGMITLNYCNPSLTNVIFEGNTAIYDVGGMLTQGPDSNPSLVNVTFNGNSAQTGGGMGNISSNSVLTNVTFSGNSATNYGGGMVNSGNSSSPVLTNVTFSGNSAVNQGGGVYNNLGNPIIRNTIMWNNNASTGAQIYNSSGVTVVSYSIVQGGYVGTGNLDADPLLGPLQNNGGFTQTMALGVGSPAIDAGDDSTCPNTDQHGVARPRGNHCDIGAYEFQLSSTTIKSIGSQDGWILESSETSNKGGMMNASASTLNLGDDSAKKQYRSILSFKTSSLPDTAVITKVTLKLKKQGVVGGGDPVTMFQGFMADIKKGIFGTASLALSDFKATANKTVGPTSPSLTSGWYSLELTPAAGSINKLATSGGLTQIRIRFKLDDNNNAVANYLKVYSGDASASSRPQLIVEYYAP